MTTAINIEEACGRRKVTRDDGAVVKRLIREAWDRDECIELDFNNILIASVSFLDEAIGLLALEKDLDEIKEKLHPKNISSFDQRLLDDILTSRARQRRRSRGRSRTAARRTPRAPAKRRRAAR